MHFCSLSWVWQSSRSRPKAVVEALKLGRGEHQGISGLLNGSTTVQRPDGLEVLIISLVKGHAVVGLPAIDNGYGFQLVQYQCQRLLLLLLSMDSTYFSGLDVPGHHNLDSPLSPTGDPLSSRKANALSTKLATVLSSSYADSEIREALRLLDVRDVQNEEELRRDLKADAQKAVIDVNARIVDDFSQVADVGHNHPTV